MLAKVSITTIQAIFQDEKQAKQVLSAAKRVTKKRAAGDDIGPVSSPVKRVKDDPFAFAERSPAVIEKSLALPISQASEAGLRETILHTNRAPLVLAFAVALLKYTMPEQPVSSRLSLAQAVVSANSRSKAASIGLEKGKTAEEEGWGEGQPAVKIMGREIRAMKRWGYHWKEGEVKGGHEDATVEEGEADTQEAIKQEGNHTTDNQPALWGLDLEALRSSKGPLVSSEGSHDGAGQPIHTAQSARAYLLKSFASLPSPANETENSAKKKPSAASLIKEKEDNLARLLQSLDLLYASWAGVLSHNDLDKRAWSWYVTVRPDVESGVAGWGGKGEVSLSKILELRRKG